jgi:hypothetical protein
VVMAMPAARRRGGDPAGPVKRVKPVPGNVPVLDDTAATFGKSGRVLQTICPAVVGVLAVADP